jgi:6-phosphofructokinase 1
VNTALEALDKIRDTATSLERVFVVEVMGRDRGFIALEVGLADGAEIILIPEIEYDSETVYRRLAEAHRRGKKSGIVVMAEGAGNCTDIAETIKGKTGFDVRLVRLGYVQRGGPPTAYSRLLACEMGAASVEFLLKRKKRHMTAVQGGRIVPIDLKHACTFQKPIDKELYRLATMLTI